MKNIPKFKFYLIGSVVMSMVGALLCVILSPFDLNLMPTIMIFSILTFTYLVRGIYCWKVGVKTSE